MKLQTVYKTFKKGVVTNARLSLKQIKNGRFSLLWSRAVMVTWILKAQ